NAQSGSQISNLGSFTNASMPGNSNLQQAKQANAQSGSQSSNMGNFTNLVSGNMDLENAKQENQRSGQNKVQ
ncbi:MAG: hypothetical protein GX111_07225, partial [Clostridiales bacterium]|nr:hypothetical protein [Clostridiales bacterium]